LIYRWTNFFRIVQKRGLDYISACCKIVLTIFQSDTKLSLALKKFQSVLKKPAVQLVGIMSESEGSSLLLTLINFEQGSTVDLTPFFSSNSLIIYKGGCSLMGSHLFLLNSYDFTLAVNPFVRGVKSTFDPY